MDPRKRQDWNRLHARAAQGNLRKRIRLAEVENRLEVIERNIAEGAEESGNEGDVEIDDGNEIECHSGPVNVVGDNSDVPPSGLPSSSPPSSPPSSPQSSSSHHSEPDSARSGSPAVSSDDSLSENESNHDDNNFNEQFANLNDDERREYLISSLKIWGLRGITKVKVDELLRILNPFHPFLPKSSKTLLKTPRSTDSFDIGSGKLWYKGIRESIPQNLSEDYFENNATLLLDVNIDGVPIYDCSEMEFWPILGCFKNCDEPFIIGVYCGVGKPADLHSFLGPFIHEVEELQENGYIRDGVTYPFHVKNYIFDAVARSFVKQCVGHNGYYACEKCDIQGRYYLRRMTFVGVDHPERTDQSFQDRLSPHHHKGRSPLEDIGTGMVSQFRLDAMHLVYLGVVKRIFSFLLYRRSAVSLTPETIQDLNEFLEHVSVFFPVEFNRLPKSLGNKDKKPSLKATEFRRSILYDAIVALKNKVSSRLYRCLLLLHCALTILSSADKFKLMNEAANIMLKKFVVSSARVFGTEFVTYNVHSVQHLSHECIVSDAPLDSFSAFKYENYLKTIKQTLRTPVKPLQQLARRDSETQGKLLKPKPPTNRRVKLLDRRNPGKVEAHEGVQFKRLRVKGFSLSANLGNRCFCTKKGDIVFLSNILRNEDLGILLAGRKFLVKENFYDFPMNSSELGIFRVSQLEPRRRYWKLKHVKAKLVSVPFEGAFVCFPLVHLHV